LKRLFYKVLSHWVENWAKKHWRKVYQVDFSFKNKGIIYATIHQYATDENGKYLLNETNTDVLKRSASFCLNHKEYNNGFID
jgi:hypothetical protein